MNTHNISYTTPKEYNIILITLYPMNCANMIKYRISIKKLQT